VIPQSKPLFGGRLTKGLHSDGGDIQLTKIGSWSARIIEHVFSDNNNNKYYYYIIIYNIIIIIIIIINLSVQEYCLTF
jgi:hypothetical protein